MTELRSKYDTRPIADPAAVVGGDKYRFTVLTDGLIRYEYAPDGQFEDRASTFAINRKLDSVPKFQVHEDESALEIITDRFHLTYNRKPFSSSGLVIDLKGQITRWGSQWRFGVEISDFGGIDNYGGTARTLDNINGRCKLEKGILSQIGFAVIEDSESMLLDGNGWVGSRGPNPDGKRVDGYLFAYGLDHKAAIKAFYAISGKTPIIPRWALGNWWSRYHAYSADQYLELMDRFGKEKVPLSVAVIDMDWHYVSEDKVTTAGWTGYSWNKGLFPDPDKFCEALHQRKLTVTLNEHPADGIHAFEDVYQELAKELRRDTSHGKPILFDPTNKAFFDALFDVVYKKLENGGVDFWWIDWQQGKISRTPGIDPLWMLNHFHFLNNASNGKRPMIFSRYAGPGSHRYPVGFSGDTIVSWESLNFQPEFTATASNIGYSWWSHDIGGHMLGGKDDELTTRWVQLGVFSPIMRLHSTDNAWMGKEPWNFKKESESIMSHYLRFRHRLIPYLYTMNVRSANDDEPIVQPLYWDNPRSRDAHLNRNQYHFGSELTIAPITTPRNPQTGKASVNGWLPPRGRYVDIFTGTIYDGGRTMNFYRDLDQYPVFAPVGAIIPLDLEEVPANGGLNVSAYEVIVVVGKDGEFILVEDIGDDAGDTSVQKAYAQRRIPIRWAQADGKLHIGPATSDSNAESSTTDENATRTWRIRFISHTAAHDASTAGLPENITVSTTCNDTIVDIPPHPLTSELTISTLGPNPQLSILPIKERVRSLIAAYQCEYAIKDRLYECVGEDGVSGVARVSRLLALGVEEGLVGPVLEMVLADGRLDY